MGQDKMEVDKMFIEIQHQPHNQRKTENKTKNVDNCVMDL